ncbi:MAG: GspJ family type II secretion system protein [Abditibacteriales bacterium]|nr:GspJ family type II secretion system protein [Abditibacteriales bacterium]MDW8365599.1 prepilin-type N-terminal cleavage/methylation domain-containing protein [Abditibacteriales bacterium]
MIKAGRRNIPYKTHAGFTLIEVLVAITIFAIVILAVANSFRAVSDATRRTQDLSDTYQTARIALNEITKTVHNFYPYLAMLPPVGGSTSTAPAALSEDEVQEQVFIGVDAADRSTGYALDSVSFVAVSTDDISMLLQSGGAVGARRRSRIPSRGEEAQMSPRFDIVAVSYYIGTDADTGREGLLRVVDRLPGLAAEEAALEVTLLSDKVRSLNLRYFDPFMKEWVDAWSEPTYFPTAVMITIGVERVGSPGELLYLSSVTSLPMGGEAPEDILAAIEESEQQAMNPDQTPPPTSGGTGGSPTGGGAGR